VGPERSKDVGDGVRDGDAKHRRLALRNLAGTRDGISHVGLVSNVLDVKVKVKISEAARELSLKLHQE
jgi:hypothetical protein